MTKTTLSDLVGRVFLWSLSGVVAVILLLLYAPVKEAALALAEK